jgi:NADH-quinone oxidoreductase subunit A
MGVDLTLLTQTAAFWVYFFGVLFICLFMVAIPVLMGGRSKGRAKHQPFESGVLPVGSAKMRFSAKFYLVAMLFVIFDIEALFLFAWSTAVREVGWLGFIEVVIFSSVLLLGLLYVWRMKVLDWSSDD